MKRMLAVGLLALGLSGCGGEKPIDPQNLPPLTAEQLAEIKKNDDVVADEEANNVRSERTASASASMKPKAKKGGKPTFPVND